jgi:hypothetical protein
MDRLHSWFRKAEVLDLACLNQVLHSPRHVLDGHVRVDPVLIVQIDGLDPESLERALDGLLDMIRPAVQNRHTLRGIYPGIEPELGGNHHLPPEGCEGFAHEFLVGERAVNFGRIKEGDAAVHGCPDKRDHFLLVSRRTIAKAHAHAAEPES